MRFERTIEVARSPAEVFAYLADMSNAATWDPGVLASRQVTEGPVAVGTEFDVVARWRGRELPFRFRIRELEPARRIVMEAEGAHASSVDTAMLAPAGDGTRITYRSDWRLRGVRRLAEPLLAPAIAVSGRRALAGLRDALGGEG